MYIALTWKSSQLPRGAWRRNVKRRHGGVNFGITLCSAFELNEITRGFTVKGYVYHTN